VVFFNFAWQKRGMAKEGSWMVWPGLSILLLVIPENHKVFMFFINTKPKQVRSAIVANDIKGRPVSHDCLINAT
jgi:hypothetical protein